MTNNHTHSTNAQLEHLSETDKLRLLSKLRQSKKQAQTTVETTLDLSHAQQRLWIIDQRTRCGYLYHVPLILNLPSDVDVAALGVAWKHLLHENPILNFVFSSHNEVVQQHYCPIDNPIVEMISTENLPHFLEISFNSPLAAFFLTKFQKDKAPLWRIALLKTPERSYLLFCFHHLIMDGWSMRILIEQLNRHYQGALKKEVVELPKAADNHYANFIAWEQQFGHLENHCHYWLNRLQGKPFTVDLMVDYPRKATLSGYGKTLHAVIPHADLMQLQQFARTHALSMNHCLLFAFQFLLSRYSGQDDITLGIPVPGRPENRWYNTIGLFVNTCLHTITIDYHRTIAEQLSLVKKHFLEDMAYANEPFDEVMKSLYARGQINPNNTFNILYNFIQYEPSAPSGLPPAGQMSDENRAATPLSTHYCALPSSKFDLSLHVYAGARQSELFLEYSTDLFQQETIRQLLNHLLLLIKRIPTAAQESLRTLSWGLSNEEELA